MLDWKQNFYAATETRPFFLLDQTKILRYK